MYSLIQNPTIINHPEDILSKTVITEKQFAVDSLNYLYTNKCKFQKLTDFQQNGQLEIKNLPCVMIGNQIKKITQISYCGQIYLIQDFYTISSNSNLSDKSTIPQIITSQSQSSSLPMQSSNKESETKPNTKKCCLFKKSKGKNESQKRCTKNVPKNFCKAFLNFLTMQRSKKHDRQRISNCIHHLKNLIGQQKCYSNPIILKIISSKSCKEFFRAFLEQHAKNWIERSKVENKKVHLDAIEIYLRLFEKKTFLQGDEDQQQQDS